MPPAPDREFASGGGLVGLTVPNRDEKVTNTALPQQSSVLIPALPTPQWETVACKSAVKSGALPGWVIVRAANP